MPYDNNLLGNDLTLDLSAVKAVGDWELDVLGVPFGGPQAGKDSDGEYFTKDTDTMQAVFKTIPAFYYHGFTPDGKAQGDPQPIGVAKYDHTDARGHWYKVILDKTSAYAKRIWDAAKNGLARASSGALSHLVRRAADGELLKWPVAELSLIDADGQRQPANRYAVAMPAAKLNYMAAKMSLPVLEDTMSDEKATKADFSITGGTISLEAVEAAVQSAMEKRDAEVAAQAKAAADLAAKVDEAVKAEKVKWEAEAAASNRLPQSAPYAAKFSDTWKYDNLSPGELGLVIDTLRGAKVGVAAAAFKALALRLTEDKRDFGTPDLAPGYSLGAMKAAGLPTEQSAYKTTTDPMLTTGSTDGGNWVHTSYAREIWAAIRATPGVVAKLPSITIPDGFKSTTFPIEGTDPTWYTVAETAAADSTMKFPTASVTASQITTPTNKEITVAKMGARVMYTGEMTEDSIIAFVPQLQRQLTLSGAEQLEHAVIDGDSTTTAYTNINDVGNGSAVTAGTLFLMMDGLRKLGLVTNTANSRSGGSLDEEDYLETMFLLGTAGLGAADMQKCGFIVDPNVYKASLKFAALKTKDVWANATLESGVLTKLWGYELMPSWFMHYKSTTRKANTAGKVDQTTPANNTTGAILAVRWDQWRFAYKRQMTIETTRFANADAWEIVAWARLGLGYRDTDAAAISYGLQV